MNTIFDKLEQPPAAKLLGWRLITLDYDKGTIEVEFQGKPEFTNPTGHIQGGLLSAMLDDTLGPALFAMTKGRLFGSTIDLHVHFLRPVPIGTITTKAQVTKLGRNVAFMEGKLFDKNGKLCASARASAHLAEL